MHFISKLLQEKQEEGMEIFKGKKNQTQNIWTKTQTSESNSRPQTWNPRVPSGAVEEKGRKDEERKLERDTTVLVGDKNKIKDMPGIQFTAARPLISLALID